MAIQFLDIVLTPSLVGLILLASVIGLFFGFLPGLGPTIALVLMIPFLNYFTTPVALLLVGIVYVVSIYGGSISAIILNVPGTGASACTTLDGYPMSRQGEAITALSLSTTASIIGGVISILVILAMTPLLEQFVLLFGSPEYFLLTVLGIAVIAVVARGALLKGLIAGFFGLMITAIGVASVSGEIRYTFGILYLYDGVQYMPALIGIFAVTEMLRLAGRGQQIAPGETELKGSPIEGILRVWKYKFSTIRSIFIGLFTGAVPGAGGAVANFVSYGIASGLYKGSDDERDFGDGNSIGVIASEASNNAMVSGSLVPALTFGIPGNATTAVLISMLLYLGVRPGPTLFAQNMNLVYTLYTGIMLGSLFLLVMYVLGPYFGRITLVDQELLVPSILIVAVLSTYALRYAFGDVVQMLFFGGIAYIMIQNGYSIIALTLGIILGPIAESNLFRTIQLGGGSFEIFLQRPMSILLIIATIVILMLSFVDLQSVIDLLIKFFSREQDRVEA